MIGSDPEAQRVRHDDADKADAAADRDRGSCRCRDGEDGNDLEALHWDAEVIGRRLAQRQGIEAP
jgi:hypothetical protein